MLLRAKLVWQIQFAYIVLERIAMTYPDEFDRQSALRAESFRADPFRTGFPGIHEVQPAPEDHENTPRAVGAPLPMGGTSRAQEPLGYRAAPPPPGRALSAPASEDTGMQRAMSVLKMAMPFVQRLLPLIDGNIATAVAGLLTPRHPAAPAQPQVDLSPLRNQMSEMQLQQADLRNQVIEHNTSLKRMDDRLEMVREATDRNTLEQQELIEDLKAVGNKVNLFALLLFAMLIVSHLLNVALFLHVKQVLH
jgi:hypothetical protein